MIDLFRKTDSDSIKLGFIGNSHAVNGVMTNTQLMYIIRGCKRNASTCDIKMVLWPGISPQYYV